MKIKKNNIINKMLPNTIGRKRTPGQYKQLAYESWKGTEMI